MSTTSRKPVSVSSEKMMPLIEISDRTIFWKTIDRATETREKPFGVGLEARLPRGSMAFAFSSSQPRWLTRPLARGEGHLLTAGPQIFPAVRVRADNGQLRRIRPPHGLRSSPTDATRPIWREPLELRG
jgi:hypothetical protein